MQSNEKLFLVSSNNRVAQIPVVHPVIGRNLCHKCGAYLDVLFSSPESVGPEFGAFVVQYEWKHYRDKKHKRPKKYINLVVDKSKNME